MIVPPVKPVDPPVELRAPSIYPRHPAKSEDDMKAEKHFYRAGPVVDRSLYTDPAVFEAEIARIFERSWLYIAHESEFRQAGDFRTTELAGQPVIAIMGEDLRIRVLYNSCRHRGALVELEASGNRKSFQCLYHHWEYGTDGRLANVPRREGQGADFRLEEHGLVPLPRVDSVHGLIFASLNPDAPPLQDWIGKAASYLKPLVTDAGKPLAVYGDYEYAYKGNWKLICENTVDDYHPQYLHAATYRESAKRIGGLGISAAFMGGQKAQEAEASRQQCDLGMHGFITWRAQDPVLTVQKQRTEHLHLSLFPSLLMLYDPIRDVVGLRVVKPDAADRTRVHTICLGPADATPERRRGIAERFNHNWGPTGRVGPDDISCFEILQKGLRAKSGGDVLITRGLDKGPLEGVAGDEQAVRAVWNGWRHYMMDEPLQT
jgi:phenylpropionate dioxygenase-like ring-hydroxylating dioxygenase large terminal subunit